MVLRPGITGDSRAVDRAACGLALTEHLVGTVIAARAITAVVVLQVVARKAQILDPVVARISRALTCQKGMVWASMSVVCGIGRSTPKMHSK